MNNSTAEESISHTRNREISLGSPSSKLSKGFTISKTKSLIWLDLIPREGWKKFTEYTIHFAKLGVASS
jgi:hypothetical protein